MTDITIVCKLEQGFALRVDDKSVALTIGINKGVDQAFYQTWLARNSGLACVRDGLIAEVVVVVEKVQPVAAAQEPVIVSAPPALIENAAQQ